MIYKIHFAFGGSPVCGNLYARNSTIDPEKITCKSCKKLLKGTVQ